MARGYVKEKCAECNGAGWKPVEGYTIQQAKSLCLWCDGEGYIWAKNPIQSNE